MSAIFSRREFIFILIITMGVCHSAYANDPQDKADAAVANILFDYDFGSEFATYVVSEDGFVDIIMARDTPDHIYSEILNRLQNHPDIDGVLSSHSGPACGINKW